MRRDCAEEQWLRPPGNQQGRKVFDLDAIEQVGLVFNVDPDKAATLAELGRRLFEQRHIVAARAAPLGAKAGNEQGR